MSCQKCGSKRIAQISGKTSDCCFYTYRNVEHDGYVPGSVGIEGGDYIGFQYCLECGQMQGEFPVPDPEFYVKIRDALGYVKSGDWDREMFIQEYPEYEHLLEDEDE